MRSISQNKRALKSILDGISTIIFDLGGVVLDLDQDKTASTFAKATGLTIEEVYDIFLGSPWAPAFECGKIPASAFRDEVRKALGQQLSDAMIDEAWNAMLGNLPQERIELLGSLRSKYQTLVLSNTNEIHIEAFNKIVAYATNGNSIDQYFDRVHYSHHLGMRKPNPDIYQKVIALHELNPDKTLFIDDMEPNIVGANNVGLKTLHLTNQDYLFELFN